MKEEILNITDLSFALSTNSEVSNVLKGRIEVISQGFSISDCIAMFIALVSIFLAFFSFYYMKKSIEKNNELPLLEKREKVIYSLRKYYLDKVDAHRFESNCKTTIDVNEMLCNVELLFCKYISEKIYIIKNYIQTYDYRYEKFEESRAEWIELCIKSCVTYMIEIMIDYAHNNKLNINDELESKFNENIEKLKKWDGCGKAKDYNNRIL